MAVLTRNLISNLHECLQTPSPTESILHIEKVLTQREYKYAMLCISSLSGISKGLGKFFKNVLSLQSVARGSFTRSHIVMGTFYGGLVTGWRHLAVKTFKF